MDAPPLSPRLDTMADASSSRMALAQACVGGDVVARRQAVLVHRDAQAPELHLRVPPVHRARRVAVLQVRKRVDALVRADGGVAALQRDHLGGGNETETPASSRGNPRRAEARERRPRRDEPTRRRARRTKKPSSSRPPSRSTKAPVWVACRNCMRGWLLRLAAHGTGSSFPTRRLPHS